MANWTDQTENSLASTFFFKIDDNFFFLIDDTFKLIIQDGADWVDQVKN